MKLTEQEVAEIKKYITMYGDDTVVFHQSLGDFIEDAASSVNAHYFGDSTYKAIAYLAMHNITLSNELAKGGNAEGKVASKTIGPVSVTYAHSGDRSELTGTRYGRMYKDLIRLCGGAISVTGTGRYI